MEFEWNYPQNPTDLWNFNGMTEYQSDAFFLVILHTGGVEILERRHHRCHYPRPFNLLLLLWAMLVLS
jgi:hypothetical protein